MRRATPAPRRPSAWLIPLLLAPSFCLVACECEGDDDDQTLPPGVSLDFEQAQLQMRRDEEEILGQAGGDELMRMLDDLRVGQLRVVKPLEGQALLAWLPEIAGWQREDPTVSQETIPYPFTTVAATYQAGGVKLTAEIIDSGNNPVMTMPFAMLTKESYEKSLEDGFERSTTVGAYPGWERWDGDEGEASLGLIVGGRYMVTLTATGAAGVAPLRAFVTSLKLDALPLDQPIQGPTTPAPSDHTSP